MQPCNPNAKLETKCLHAGYTPKNGGPGTVPIVQSTTYRFDSTEKVAELFDMPMEPMYSRFANPTCDAVEQKIAALEGGVGAMLTSSGQAASLLSVLNLCSAGDSIVSVSTIYGGTVNLFGVTLKRFGIECIWVDPLADEETISQAIQPNTKLFFGETIANPALTVFDIEKFAKIAHAHQIPLIVDNTFATPILCRPIEFGADIVIHYDPWWNVAVENQATDRAHRIGQKNVVTVYKLIAKGTIEEKIIKLQQMKKELAEEILSGDEIKTASFQREELLELLEERF